MGIEDLKPGMVKDGFMFNGGDPKSASSWSPIPGVASQEMIQRRATAIWQQAQKNNPMPAGGYKTGEALTSEAAGQEAGARSPLEQFNAGIGTVGQTAYLRGKQALGLNSPQDISALATQKAIADTGFGRAGNVAGTVMAAAPAFRALGAAPAFVESGGQMIPNTLGRGMEALYGAGLAGATAAATNPSMNPGQAALQAAPFGGLGQAMVTPSAQAAGRLQAAMHSRELAGSAPMTLPGGRTSDAITGYLLGHLAGLDPFHSAAMAFGASPLIRFASRYGIAEAPALLSQPYGAIGAAAAPVASSYDPTATLRGLGLSVGTMPQQ